MSQVQAKLKMILAVHSGIISIIFSFFVTACQAEQFSTSAPVISAGLVPNSLLTDPDNCGAPGHSCRHLSNTDGVACENGFCVINSCQGGFADCNNVVGDGCETYLFHSPSQCGSCAFSECRPQNNVQANTCDQIAGCGIGLCQSGYGDCNNLVVDGCETSLESDPFHCGECGKICLNYPNMSTSCSDSQCTYSCEDEYYDVDGQLENGCEFENINRGNHTKRDAHPLPEVRCGAEPRFSQISGTIPADKRQHPDLSISRNNTTADWYSFKPTFSSNCQQSLDIQLMVTGANDSTANCYQATFFTTLGVFEAEAPGNGSSALERHANAFENLATIYIKVQKKTAPSFCSLPNNEVATYFLNFRL